MKRILAAVLALALLCGNAAALAEGKEKITLEVKTGRFQVYDAEDSYSALFRKVKKTEKKEEEEEEEEEPLPMLLLPLGNNLQLQVSVLPRTEKNRKTVLSVDDSETVQIRGSQLTGLKAGETVLTVASEQDPSVVVRYRVIVYRPVSRITLTGSDKRVGVGETTVLKASYEPKDATVKKVIWSSSDERIASVDAKGTVTGLKRGKAWIRATARDGGSGYAAFCVEVVQNTNKITLDQTDVTVDTGKAVNLRASILPKDANDKSVVWSSSDEKIAKVNAYGRVTGIAPGDCSITCASKKNGAVQAAATVHVQQPVRRIIFADPPAVYVNGTGRLKWKIEPANASHPEIALSSGNEAVLKIGEDGTITGVSAGTAVVSAVAKDGSNRKSQVKVTIMQHLESVRMKRRTAYIDIGEYATASAELTPAKYVNPNMTWKSANPSVASVRTVKGAPDRVQIIGAGKGETTVTGTTEDGGLKASIRVKVGDWSHAAKISSAEITGKGKVLIRVVNESKNLNLTYIVAEIEAFDSAGKPVNINKKDGSNIVKAIYDRQLSPGKTTVEDKWTLQDYDPEKAFQRMTVRVVKYQINGDWVKTLRKSLQPTFEYKP